MLDLSFSRRQFLGHSVCAASLFTTSGLFAEELTRTASIGEGPFYPDHMPLDTDNDLLIINDAITPAVGSITHLSGRVLDSRGEPLRNAFVEIWQVDNNGAYLHSGSGNADRRDSNFQGYGRFLTDVKGNYYFRTIKPVAYPGRTPHIHLAVSRNGHRVFTTQVLIKGEKQNERDGLFRNIRDEAARKTVLADFEQIPGSKIGELSANFDVVLGVTIEDSHSDEIKGGIGKPEFRGRPRRGQGRPRPPRS